MLLLSLCDSSLLAAGLQGALCKFFTHNFITFLVAKVGYYYLKVSQKFTNSLWIKLNILLLVLVALPTVGKRKEFLGSHCQICRFVVLVFCTVLWEFFSSSWLWQGSVLDQTYGINTSLVWIPMKSGSRCENALWCDTPLLLPDPGVFSRTAPMTLALFPQ